MEHPAIVSACVFLALMMLISWIGYRFVYKPSRLLRHLIEARTASCTAPGCRRPAAQCDQDHTIPYEAGARTCECTLGPLCRRHHRCKQARGWTLEQPQPGIFVWITPARRRYITGPKTYAT